MQNFKFEDWRIGEFDFWCHERGKSKYIFLSFWGNKRRKTNKYSAPKYLLKVDDDSYVQLPLVLEELKNSNFDKSLYWGFFDGRAPVWLKGKWAEKEYHLCDKYIPYALGGGYVLSHVRRILFIYLRGWKDF